MRATLLVLGVVYAGKLSTAEYLHAHGWLASRSLQESLDCITEAGETFPWAHRFRYGQAQWLYLISIHSPQAIPIAIISLQHAIDVDPLAAADLIAPLFDLQARAGMRKEAAATAIKLQAAARNSDRVRQLLRGYGYDN